MQPVELDQYMNDLAFFFVTIDNFIDYSHIDKPIKSVLKPEGYTRLNDLSKNFKTFLFQGHEYTDSTSRLQLFYEGEKTEFLTLWKNEDYSRDLFGAKETHLLQYEFALGSK